MASEFKSVSSATAAAGLVQIEGQIPSRRGFYQAWIAPLTSHIQNLFTEQQAVIEKDLTRFKDEVETEGLIRIEGQIPSQKGFYQAWIAPVTSYFSNPFAKRTKQPSDEEKRIAEQEAMIAELQAQLAQVKAEQEAEISKLKAKVTNVRKKSYKPKIGTAFDTNNLASFKIKPVCKDTTQAIKHFEKIWNTSSECTNMQVRNTIHCAYEMGCRALEDMAALQSQYPELKDKTPPEIFQDQDCYLSYFLQKAKNSLSCWPVEQAYFGFSDEVVELSKNLDANLTEKAKSLGITLIPDYTLPSSLDSETADEVVELSENLDANQTEKAKSLGITLIPDYTLSSSLDSETADQMWYSAEEQKWIWLPHLHHS